MSNCTKGFPKVTVGMDLGDRFSQLCFLNAEAEVVERKRIRTTPEAVREEFENRDRLRIALETGTHSPWVSELLKEGGHEVIVANSRRLAIIYKNKNKSDKTDAETLARVARADPELLAPIQHREGKTRRHLSVLRSRDSLVGVRKNLINHVRGTVKSYGARLPRCSAPAFHNKVPEFIPEDLAGFLTPVLKLIGNLTQTIKQFDKSISDACEKLYKETDRLRQLKGVGPITALAYILILEDPRRFKRARQVGAYVGLTPRQDDSGNSKPQLRITKSGDKFLRRLLVNCAQYILGPFGEDSDLRQHGLAIAKRGGKNAKKRAVVAVARKLSVLLYRLWVTGEEYEPLRNTKRKVRPRMERVA